MAKGETPRVTRVYEAKQTRSGAAIERVWRKHQEELPVPATQRLHPSITREEERLSVKHGTSAPSRAAQPTGCSDCQTSTNVKLNTPWEWSSLPRLSLSVWLRCVCVSSIFHFATSCRLFRSHCGLTNKIVKCRDYAVWWLAL